MAGLRFAPNSFQYNGRVGCALLPSLIVLAGFGGKTAVGILMVGAMVTYILDAMRYREGAIGAIWLTLGMCNLSLVFTSLTSPRPIPLSILVSIINGTTLFMTGVWATVNFKWVQMQYPVVVLAFEKLLIGCCLPVAATVQMAGLIAAVGVQQAPYYLAVLLAVLYCVFALPLPTSFQLGNPQRSTGGKGRTDTTIQSPLEGFMAAVLLVCLPGSLYAITHWTLSFHWLHFWSLLLLHSGPLLFMCVLEEGIWWLPMRPSRRNALRKLVLLATLAAALAGLEGRVIFRAFGQYILLRPPWNYIAVTCALYGFAALLVLHYAGLLGEALGGTVAGTALVVSAAAGSLAAGVPLMVMPAPLIAASGLALYHDSHSLRDYALFAGGALLTGGWFVFHHFWFLDIHMEGMPLRMLCKLLLAAMVPAALLPGLIASGASRSAVSALLLCQAVVMAALEEHLYAGDHAEGSAEMYPAYLVVLTSGLGIAVARKLRDAKRVGEVASWGLQCIYGAKLAMLLLPEAKLALPVLGVVLAVTPPLLLYRTKEPQRRRLKPWQGLAHAGSVIAAVGHARFAVFDIMQWVGAQRPSEGLMAGSLVLVATGGCIPLVSRQYQHSQAVKRALALCVAAGMLLVLLRPPLPIKGGSGCPHLPFGWCPRLWDDAHVPEHEEDDIAIYGTGASRREHWPLWMLVGAVMAGLAAATSTLPVHKSVSARLTYAAVSGVCIGAYLALEFFPGIRLLQLLLLGGTLLVAAFLVLLQLPTAASPAWLPWMAALWGLLFPVGLCLQAQLPLPPLPQDALRLFPDAARQVDAERYQSNRAALMAIYAAEALLLAFALKMKVAAALAGHRGPSSQSERHGPGMRSGGRTAQRAAGFLGACLPTPHSLVPVHRMPGLKGAAGQALARLSAEGLAWVPTAGNLLTLLCFTLCLALNSQLTQSSDAAIFALAPMLLLLNQDPLLFRGLSERQRYFPLALAASVYLAASATAQMIQHSFVQAESIVTADTRNMGFFVKNLVMMLAVLPMHVAFAQYLWSRERIGGLTILMLTPLALPVLLLADILTVKILAGLSLAMALVQYLAMRHVRHQGMKLI
ncbi:hypothetical protein WJX72_011089 [[Myrmecia] bisecta]|uniref:No exine formation 1 n=1 Tax=[Myrmecia] bisecta TaxID=41462 RepID=A0AAW1QSS6_9CHLO